MLIENRDQRVEDLEKRLKSMEELMKGHVSDQPPGLNDTEKWKGFRGIGAAHFSEQSNSGSSMSNPNSNSISTASGADSESPDVSLPSPEGKYQSATQISLSDTYGYH